MKRFVGPPLVFLWVASLLLCDPAAWGKPGLLTYHDPTNGYTIQYDPSINFFETHTSLDEWHMKSDKSSAYFMLGLKITSTQKTYARDVCQEVCSKISQSAKSVSKIVPVSLVPGMFAYSFRASQCGVDEEGSEYVVLDGKGHAYMFAALTYPDQFIAQKKRWEKVIASFRFDH